MIDLDVLIAEARGKQCGCSGDYCDAGLVRRLADRLEAVTAELERERDLGAARQRFVAETARHNEQLLAERDAALAAVERVRQVYEAATPVGATVGNPNSEPSQLEVTENASTPLLDPKKVAERLARGFQ